MLYVPMIAHRGVGGIHGLSICAGEGTARGFDYIYPRDIRGQLNKRETIYGPGNRIDDGGIYVRATP